jgi:hypothetical protein
MLMLSITFGGYELGSDQLCCTKYNKQYQVKQHPRSLGSASRLVNLIETIQVKAPKT